MGEASVLVAESDVTKPGGIAKILVTEKIELLCADTFETALEILKRGSIHVLVVDANLSGGPRVGLFRELVEQGEPEAAIFVANEPAGDELERVSSTIVEFVRRPVDADQLRFAVRKALAFALRKAEAPPPSALSPGEIIGSSSLMKAVHNLIQRAAPGSATILIRGESGTGKELVAREIHRRSSRSRERFQKIDCTSFPETLLESELFGYERGAFTGAVERRLGKFEAAAGGTLFLDEIADMPLALQAKLLRVLQEREFTRVGGRDAIRADVRIIAASNQDLEAAVRGGRFREDLFFRLNVVRIHVPPLRERRGDIPELIEFFIDRVNRELGTAFVGVSDDARELLARHTWPGNVRELENAMLRAAVLARGGRMLTHDDFDLAGQPRQTPTETLPLEEAVRRRLADLLAADASATPSDLHALLIGAVERPLIEVVLERAGGNQVKAADMLGINRNTLRKKITELGIEIRRGGAAR